MDEIEVVVASVDEEQGPTTPNGSTIVVHQPNGFIDRQIDVTEAVQVLYDLAVSYGVGSGFWTLEDVTPVLDLARAAGFADLKNIEAYVEAEKRHTELRAEIQEKAIEGIEHNHYFSPDGQCMVAHCEFHK